MKFWRILTSVCWIFGHYYEPYGRFNGIVYTWKCLLCEKKRNMSDENN